MTHLAAVHGTAVPGTAGWLVEHLKGAAAAETHTEKNETRFALGKNILTGSARSKLLLLLIESAKYLKCSINKTISAHSV